MKLSDFAAVNYSLSHLNAKGEAHMVDVGNKPIHTRTAIAAGELLCATATLDAIREDALPKGDVLAVARIAGIQAAKQTSELIPLCHLLPLTKVTMDIEIGEDRLLLRAEVRTDAKTGVEMEALTAVSVAGLTLYDMLKAIDKAMSLHNVRLLKKKKQ